MVAYLMGAALIVASLALPASAAETPIKQCPPGQIAFPMGEFAGICGQPMIDRGMRAQPLNDWLFSRGNITSRPECPDGWHLVLTQGFAPMCAWVLREPTN